MSIDPTIENATFFIIEPETQIKNPIYNTYKANPLHGCEIFNANCSR